jgi:hypothetical protein
MTFVGFKANKNGTNQSLTNNVVALATFGTEVYDVGAHFASNLWTPPSGKISLCGACRMTGTMNVPGGSAIIIQKNGANVHVLVESGTTGEVVMCLAYDDTANGSDTYGLAVQGSCTAGNPTLDGSTAFTGFSGYVLDSTKDCFAATNGTTNQTGLTSGSPVTVTYGTEIYDVNSKFASNAWVPAAGVVWLKASCYITGTMTTNNNAIVVSILKNGTAIATASRFSISNRQQVEVAVLDKANGTDSYTVQATPSTTSGTATISSNLTGDAVTTFEGHFIEVPQTGDFATRFNMPMLGF